MGGLQRFPRDGAAHFRALLLLRLHVGDKFGEQDLRVRLYRTENMRKKKKCVALADAVLFGKDHNDK